MSKKSTYPIVDISMRNVARSAGVAASTLLAAATSVVVGRVVDGLASGASGVGALLALALVLAVASAAATVFLGEWVPTWLGVRRFLDGAMACVRDILAAPQRAFARHEKGHFVNVLMNSTDTYGMLLYAGASVRIPGAVLALVGTVTVAALIDPLMAALVVVYAPVLWLALRLPARSLAELQRDVLPVQDAWLGESKLIVENKRSVNAAGAEGYFSARYRERSEAFLRTVTRYRFLELLISNLPALLSCALAAAMMGVAAWRCLTVGAGVGQVLVAYSLAQLVQMPLTAIAQRMAQVRGNLPHVERLREVAAAAAEPSGFEALTAGEKNLAARVEGTLWATPERGEDGKRLFAGEFEVRPGELVVVKGANGSGKSRLLDFLRGLSDPADLDGEAALAPEALHAAYLTYPVPVFTGDLAYNLLGAAADPEVARLLDLGDLPERAITDQPLNLSLGERQKLGLLRALSRPEPVVLLDEPLANLDAASSARLCAYLAGLRGHRTVVAIMHSDDLDAAADRIYEIRDARLARAC